MRDNDAYLNILLNKYKKRLAEESAELKLLPEGDLKIRMERGRTNYTQNIKQNGRRPLRKGITTDKKMISQLARKKYLEISTALLKTEIDRLQDFIDSRTDPSVQNVLDLLPYQYQQLDESMFFPQIKEMQHWQDMPYEQNTKYAHKKIHITSKGLRVRSKSELIIAEKLDTYNIPYRYDSLVTYKNQKLSPDFTIRIEEITYWEHCGMMNDPQYRSYNKWKLEQYEKIGIVPWKNLIITYDMEDGGINSAFIDAVIKHLILN